VGREGGAVSWAARFTAAMIVEREGGADFDLAFALALKRHPVEPRELGVSHRSRGSFAELQATEWWRGVCEDAWFGRRPALRALPQLAGLVGDVDFSTSAGRKSAGGAERAHMAAA